MDKQKVEKILRLINLLKSKELENGLSEEDIIYKYTYGSCVELASFIKNQFKDDTSIWRVCVTRMFYKEPSQYGGRMQMEGSFWHVCIGLGELDENYLPTKGSLIFDINGCRTVEEMGEYLNNAYRALHKGNTYKDITSIFSGPSYVSNAEKAIQEIHQDFLKEKQKSEDTGEM